MRHAIFIAALLLIGCSREAPADAQQGATWTRERETAEQLLTAIAKFREVWG